MVPQVYHKPFLQSGGTNAYVADLHLCSDKQACAYLQFSDSMGVPRLSTLPHSVKLGVQQTSWTLCVLALITYRLFQIAWLVRVISISSRLSTSPSKGVYFMTMKLSSFAQVNSQLTSLQHSTVSQMVSWQLGLCSHPSTMQLTMAISRSGAEVRLQAIRRLIHVH